MKKNLLLLLFLIFSFSFAQESFTMKYACMKPFKNGVWGNTQKTFVQVDFSVGTNKDIILINKQGQNRFVRTADPFVSETDSGMKYQVIPVTNGGKKYVLQYLENYNLRVIRVSDNFMVEYGCVQEFDEYAGTNHTLYSVVTERAYFHNEPNLKTKRSAYLIYGEVVEPLAERGSFFYVVFTNLKGVKTKGWILKSNLSSY